MPSYRNKGTEDLHGNAPDCSRIVLLLVDVINDLDFPRNEDLVRKSEELAGRIAGLSRRCREAGIPVIYVNDNKGRWRSDFSDVVKHCLRADSPGREMLRRLLPWPKDYVVLKPKHSAFYATPLETLLEHIGAETVILAGIATNACVMITASDIYVRDYKLLVPSDCVAALTENDQRQALDVMERNYNADTSPSRELHLDPLSR